MDSQFHMAREASQSWWKVKGKQRQVFHGGRQERVCRGTALYKTTRSHETYSLSWEQNWKNLSPWFYYLPPGPFSGDYGSYNFQDEIWMATQANCIKHLPEIFKSRIKKKKKMTFTVCTSLYRLGRAKKVGSWLIYNSRILCYFFLVFEKTQRGTQAVLVTSFSL